MTLGAINHVALSVSNLAASMKFYRPIFEFLGYKHTGSFPGVEIWEFHSTGTAVNLWQAKPEHLQEQHHDYALGLHHLAFNASTREQVDEFYRLLTEMDANVVDPPAEYDYAPGYYAVFFKDLDDIRIELVHIPDLHQS